MYPPSMVLRRALGRDSSTDAPASVRQLVRLRLVARVCAAGGAGAGGLGMVAWSSALRESSWLAMTMIVGMAITTTTHTHQAGPLDRSPRRGEPRSSGGGESATARSLTPRLGRR